MTYPIAPNGIFWTLQGEGALSGEPMAFLRLAGCSVGCLQCDTDYRVDRRLTVEQIYETLRIVTPIAFNWPWVWITGGEPTDHDLEPLIGALQAVGYRVALATSGMKRAPADLQWISVSPHSSAAVQRTGHEIKIVPGLNGLTWEDVTEIARWSFPYRFLQPLWWQTANGPEADGVESHKSLVACRDFVLTHPGWRLTSQAHKQWGLP